MIWGMTSGLSASMPVPCPLPETRCGSIFRSSARAGCALGEDLVALRGVERHWRSDLGRRRGGIHGEGLLWWREGNDGDHRSLGRGDEHRGSPHRRADQGDLVHALALQPGGRRQDVDILVGVCFTGRTLDAPQVGHHHHEPGSGDLVAGVEPVGPGGVGSMGDHHAGGSAADDCRLQRLTVGRRDLHVPGTIRRRCRFRATATGQSQSDDQCQCHPPLHPPHPSGP